LESSEYIRLARAICLRFPMQVVRMALSLAEERTGKRSEARMAIMAITTRSSIKVNAKTDLGWELRIGLFKGIKDD